MVKNVTGYDLSKLIAGSFGTLAAVTEITVKTLPAPEETRTVMLRGLDDATALAAMTAAMGGPYEVSGAAHLPGDATLLADRRPCAFRRRRAAKRSPPRSSSFGTAEIVGREASLTRWRHIRDAMPLANLARPCDLARLGAAERWAGAGRRVVARSFDFKHFYDWAGGLVWLAVAGATDGGAAAIRAALPEDNGHATLLRASDAMRETVPVFQPLAPALAALSARVKSTFDPTHILNPGRMYRRSLDRATCRPHSPWPSWPIPMSRRRTRSCAPACIAASAPRPARPMCCSATSSTGRAAEFI